MSLQAPGPRPQAPGPGAPGSASSSVWLTHRITHQGNRFQISPGVCESSSLLPVCGCFQVFVCRLLCGHAFESLPCCGLFASGLSWTQGADGFECISHLHVLIFVQ